MITNCAFSKVMREALSEDTVRRKIYVFKGKCTYVEFETAKKALISDFRSISVADRFELTNQGVGASGNVDVEMAWWIVPCSMGRDVIIGPSTDHAILLARLENMLIISVGDDGRSERSIDPAEIRNLAKVAQLNKPESWMARIVRTDEVRRRLVFDVPEWATVSETFLENLSLNGLQTTIVGCKTRVSMGTLMSLFQGGDSLIHIRNDVKGNVGKGSLLFEYFDDGPKMILIESGAKLKVPMSSLPLLGKGKLRRFLQTHVFPKVRFGHWTTIYSRFAERVTYLTTIRPERLSDEEIFIGRKSESWDDTTVSTIRKGLYYFGLQTKTDYIDEYNSFYLHFKYNFKDFEEFPFIVSPYGKTLSTVWRMNFQSMSDFYDFRREVLPDNTTIHHSTRIVAQTLEGNAVSPSGHLMSILVMANFVPLDPLVYLTQSLSLLKKGGMERYRRHSITKKATEYHSDIPLVLPFHNGLDMLLGYDAYLRFAKFAVQDFNPFTEVHDFIINRFAPYMNERTTQDLIMSEFVKKPNEEN